MRSSIRLRSHSGAALSIARWIGVIDWTVQSAAYSPARVDLRASVFCTVREKVPYPLCGFYAAAFTRLLALFDIGASTEVVACRATGESTCVLNVSLVTGQPAASASVEAL